MVCAAGCFMNDISYTKYTAYECIYSSIISSATYNMNVANNNERVCLGKSMYVRRKYTTMVANHNNHPRTLDTRD